MGSLVHLQPGIRNVEIEREWRCEGVLRLLFEFVCGGQVKPSNIGVHPNGRANESRRNLTKRLEDFEFADRFECTEHLEVVSARLAVEVIDYIEPDPII